MDYSNFEVGDFLSDDSFIRWVKNPSAQHNEFWHDWLMRHPEKRDAVENARLLLETYDVQNKTHELTQLELSKLTGQVQARIDAMDHGQRKKGILIYFNWARVAAILIAVTTFGIWLYTAVHQNQVNIVKIPDNQLIRYTNNTSQSKFLRLEDGTLIILKPRSSVHFPKIFNGPKREVSLQGEAFFEVHKNPARPFLIHSGNMTTSVLGTSFTIKAFSGDRKYRVIVNTGKVLVSEQRGPAAKPLSVTLFPHQQAILYNDRTKLIKDTVSTRLILAAEVARKEFSFYNTPVVTVIKKLEMAYHVNIEFNEKELAGSTFTASLSDLPLDEKIIVICKTINANYDFSDGRIQINKPINQ